MSGGDQQLIGLLQKAQLNSGIQNDQGNTKQITIRDSEVDRLMIGMVIDIQGLKTLVIKYQNIDKGFYLYEDWQQLHEIIFDAKHDAIIQMWRVLKLINFGDDYMPTGLVFDTLVTLFNIEAKTEESEQILRRLFFRFIEINGKQLTEKEKDQIEFLKAIKRIVEGYRDMIRQKLREGEVISPRQDNRPRYQSLHQLHGLYTYKRNLKKLRKIDDELKNCTFEPELYQSRQHVQSRYFTSASKTFDQPLQQEQLFETKIFRANPIPDYPQRYPKGFTPHITRMKQHIEHQHQRSLSKPIIIPPKIEEFSIGRRDRERKTNTVKSKAVLFMIEAQVGKRKFWINVREGMTEEQVVKQIELLAGFQDREIASVVEQYFMNYFKKTHNIDI